MYIFTVIFHLICYFSECSDGIRSILTDSTHKKMSRDNALRALLATATEKLSLEDTSPPPPPSLTTSTFWSLCAQQLQTLALDCGLRLKCTSYMH